MCELIPTNVQKIVAVLRERIRAVEMSGYTNMDLGVEFPWEFPGPPGEEEFAIVADGDGRPKGLAYWANWVWTRWRDWVHANVDCGNIQLDDRGRRIAPQPAPGHREPPGPEYLGACLLVNGDQDEKDFFEAAGVLLKACLIDILPGYRFLWGLRMRIDHNQADPGIGPLSRPEAIWYVVDMRMIGLDAITFACRYRTRTFPNVTMKNTFKQRLNDHFCQVSLEAGEARDGAREPEPQPRDINERGYQQDGERAWDPPDDYNLFEHVERTDMWIAAERNVRHRASEPDSGLSPENAVLVYQHTVAINGAVLPPARCATDRQLAQKLRIQTGNRTWDLKAAGEARELVKGWVFKFVHGQHE